jgi:hypothetical protein
VKTLEDGGKFADHPGHGEAGGLAGARQNGLFEARTDRPAASHECAGKRP